MANWKVYLAESSDLTFTKDITAISRDKTLTLSHNRSGSFNCNLPLSANNLELSKTNQNCIIVLKDGVIVWSGPIWTRSIKFNESKIEVSAVGWFEILMYRFLISTVPSFTNATEGNIVLGTSPAGLLKIANDNTPTWITAGTNPAGGSLRTITYEIFQSIGENIINLSDMEYGFDIYLDPETRQLNIRDADDFDDRTNIPFGYNWGPDNIQDIVIEENGGEMRNKVHVVSPNNVIYTAPNTASITDNNLLEEVIQITEEDDPLVLQAIANAEVAVKGYPPINYEITLKPQGAGNPYGIFEDYNIGDRIQFTANKNVDGELIQIEHAPRIFAATITIDDNGREVVSSLQTTFSP
jgi:hypothetical protein